jgi:hypothetical protein
MTPFIVAKRPLLVGVPPPPFDDTDGVGAGLELRENLKNAIPFQFGSHIARVIDGNLITEITQIARVGRTKLNPLNDFCISLSTRVAYDATLLKFWWMMFTVAAELWRRSGVILFRTAARSVRSRFWPVRPVSGRLKRNMRTIGSAVWASLGAFWIEEIGHDISCFTEAEGITLAVWGAHRPERGHALIQSLRNQLFTIAGEGMLRESHGHHN